VKTLGLIVGLTLAAIGGLITLVIALPSSWPLSSDNRIALGFFLVVMLVGIGIVRWASPGFFGLLAHALARGGRWLLTPGAFLDPIGLIVWTLVAGTALIALLPVPRIFIAFNTFAAYLIASALLLMLLPRWWYRFLVTILLGSQVVMFGLIFVAEAFERNSIGQGALGFLGPLMLSWAVLPVTGLIRLLTQRARGPEVS
jgi:hypothetical protein